MKGRQRADANVGFAASISSDPPAAEGRQRPVRDREMQPFTFEFVRVGICDP
jgi:hypothetical protein